MARYKNENKNFNASMMPDAVKMNENSSLSSSSTGAKQLQHLDPNAVVEIDMITDISVNPPAKAGATYYGYIEFLLDDVVNKIVTEQIPIEFVQPRTEYAPATIVQCRCRRPYNYVPMSATDDTRIYIAGIPNSVDRREQFEPILRSFGDVNSIAAIANVGYYVEYREPLAASKAVRGLTGFVFAERALYANYASEAFKVWLMGRGIGVTGLFEDDELFEAANSGRFDLNYKYSSSIFAPDPLRDFYDDVYNRKISLTQVLVNFVHTQKHLRGSWPVVTPTRILVLMNLFDAQHEFPLKGNTDENRRRQIQELRSEIEDEVEKYGRVRTLFLITDPPQPPELKRRNNKQNDDGDEQQQQHQNINSKNATTNLDDEFDAAEALLQQIDVDFKPLLPLPGSTEEAAADAANALAPKKMKLTAEEKKQKELEEQKQIEEAMLEWHKQRLHPIFGEDGVGKVFIEYETVEEAERAQRAIAGRLFNGRTIITSYLYEDVLYPPQDDDNNDEEEVEDDEKENQNNNNNNVDAAVKAEVKTEERKEADGVVVTSLDEEID